MSSDSYLTGGGIRVHRTVEPLAMENAIEPIVDALDARRGVLLASSYEYPGRYTRWDMGFVDPPLALVARDRRLRAEALNPRGRVLLSAIARALRSLDQIEGFERTRRRGRGDGARTGDRLRGRRSEPAALGVLAAPRADRALPARRGAASRALRRLRLRSRVPVRADPRAPAAPGRPARSRPLPARRADHRGPSPRGGPAAPLRLRGGRPRHDGPAPRGGVVPSVRGCRHRAARGRPRARRVRRGRSRGPRGLQARRSLRGGPGPDLLRALSLAARRSSSAGYASATRRPTGS